MDDVFKKMFMYLKSETIFLSWEVSFVNGDEKWYARSLFLKKDQFVIYRTVATTFTLLQF